MEELVKKLETIKELIKAIRQTKQQTSLPSIPQIPAHQTPSAPSMTPKSAGAPKISSGQGPNSKKDPRKVAQQIKDGSMSTKTQKVMLKADSVTGQWYLEPTDPSSI